MHHQPFHVLGRQFVNQTKETLMTTIDQELAAGVEGGMLDDLWPTVKCLLVTWLPVIDGFSCEGVR